MNTKKRRRFKRDGVALVLAVLAMVLLLVTGGALLALGYQSRVYQVRTSFDIAARCAADTALTKAVYEINQQLQSGQLDNDNLPHELNVSLDGSDSSFSYQISRQVDGAYVIEATGTSNGAQRTVQSTLSLSNPFDFAVFAEEGIKIDQGGNIDWYNYTAEDDPLKIGTNSIAKDKVVLNNIANVYGDVHVGPRGEPSEVISLKNGSQIHGDTSAQSTINTLPSVSVPPALAALSSSGEIKETKTLTSSSSGKYKKIDLGNSEVLTIKGPVELYITENIKLGESAKIEIDDSVPNSSLTIYLAGKYEGKNSSEINNNTGIPRNFKFYGLDSCEDMVFKNGSDLYGIVYAPKADIIVDNSADIYGSIVGNRIDLKNSVTMYYDASLREYQSSDELVSLEIERWSE